MDYLITGLICVAIIIGLLNLFKKSNVSAGKNAFENGEKLLQKLDAESKAIRDAVRDTISVGNSTLLSGVSSSTRPVVESVKFLAEGNEKKIDEMKLELTRSLDSIRENIDKNLKDLREENIRQMRNIRDDNETQLKKVRDDNEKQLGEMRLLVEQKLNEALNEKLTQSFSLINERLESVYKGLGEMKDLASGVTDLKKVLTNVKTRGVWGEISLDNILEGILTGKQYERSVFVGGKQGERVDFAVVLPGTGDEKVYLPIDVKFPTEDYQRLVDASEGNDLEKYAAAVKSLERAIKEQAKSISQKYINPPVTTDFAVMYLSTEGLYAEVLRNAGLVEELQNKYRITPAGPSTITALLNSLKLGFKTLAIQKSSMEVFKAFSEFKKNFAFFVQHLETAKEQVEKASGTLDKAANRTSMIQKKLDKLENLLPESIGEAPGQDAI